MQSNAQNISEKATAVMKRRERGRVRYWLDGTAVHFVIDGVTHCGLPLGGETHERPIRATYCPVCVDVATAVTERDKLARVREDERRRNLSVKDRWLK